MAQARNTAPFLTDREARGLVDTFPRGIFTKRGATRHSWFPFVRAAVPEQFLDDLYERVTAATGLPLDGLLADPSHPCQIVCHRPDESWTDMQTAFDLATARGRGTCAVLNRSMQRYAEAIVWLTAPADGGGSYVFGRERFAATVGSLLWWTCADRDNAPIPEATYSIQRSAEPCWILQFRWRRPVAIEPLTPDERLAFARAFSAGSSGCYTGPALL